MMRQLLLYQLYLVLSVTESLIELLQLPEEPLK
jgi:hypothetical protein